MRGGMSRELFVGATEGSKLQVSWPLDATEGLWVGVSTQLRSCFRFGILVMHRQTQVGQKSRTANGEVICNRGGDVGTRLVIRMTSRLRFP